MPRGDKSKYSAKQVKQAKDIEKGYEKKGTPKEKAERIAWSTVNKMWGGAKKNTGETSPKNKEPAKKGGKKGGAAAAKRPAAARKASAQKAAKTRARNKKS